MRKEIILFLILICSSYSIAQTKNESAVAYYSMGFSKGNLAFDLDMSSNNTLLEVYKSNLYEFEFGFESDVSSVFSVLNYKISYYKLNDSSHQLNFSYNIALRPFRKMLTRFQPYISLGIGLHGIPKGKDDYNYLFVILPKVGVDYFIKPKFAISVFSGYNTTINNNFNSLTFGVGFRNYVAF